jgi:hypothetical protein
MTTALPERRGENTLLHFFLLSLRSVQEQSSTISYKDFHKVSANLTIIYKLMF